MIQTATDLRTAIKARYASNRAFCAAFSEASGVTLIEQTLSRQLSGRVNLSGGWKAAYNLYFETQEEEEEEYQYQDDFEPDPDEGNFYGTCEG